MKPNHQLQLTGAAILVSRASLSLQAAPATELYRSLAWHLTVHRQSKRVASEAFMAATKSKNACWFFNTDETESEGEGAHQRMIDESCIAAWGTCIRHGGAKETLEQPDYGDTVFLFRAGHGIVAIADVTDDPPTPSTTIFPDGDREFRRPVRNLRVAAEPLSCADIRDATGYDLPCRHIVCRIRNDAAVKYILSYFANGKQKTARRRG